MSLSLAQAIRWRAELTKCERDPEYLARTYLWITGKEQIGRVQIIPRLPQQMVLDAMRQQYADTGYVRLIIGKARQHGITTICRALSFHQSTFQPNRNTFFVNYDEVESLNVFAQFDKSFLEGLPPQLQPVADSNARARIVFKHKLGRSQALAGHALNTNVGASQMNHVLHLTEAARYRNGGEVQSSLFPTLSAAKTDQGFGQGHSFAVIESTAHIYGKWFKDFTEASARGENGDWRFLFLPAHLNPDYRTPIPAGFQLDPEEREVQRQYKLPLEFMVWRRARRQEYAVGGKLHLFQQDYPESWEEAWTLPEGAMRVFLPDDVERLRQGARPGKRMEPESSGLIPLLGGRVEVWELPEDGVFYDMGIDVAQGASASADWTVLSVFRRDTLTQVAECRIHLDPATIEFVDLVYWLGLSYNTAQMNPDITAGWAHYLMNELQARSYSNIWRWRKRDDAMERTSNRLGFLFTHRDKRHLVTNGVALVRQGAVTIRSETLLNEMEVYLSLGVDEWGAAPGYHDDAVTAFLLAMLAARDEGGGRPVPKALPEPIRRESYATHDIDADLMPAGRGAAINTSPWEPR